ncbi:hypothetical protein PR048_002585 [Dryococelus australis]|uniref:Uncharacterized protein n=1 Tax=Dryococelus australis TaxID=614101 RepID=A0ABQ9IKQ2_9NEOP|nr:hypothetical protein PR048_002585 [Dryococelus australis]
MEQRRNSKAGKPGDPRETPPTSVIGTIPLGIEPSSPRLKASSLTTTLPQPRGDDASEAHACIVLGGWADGTCEGSAVRFEWPVARAVESHEVLQVQLLSYNKYLSNKVLGTYGLVLQKVVQDGCLALTDTLLDLNNKPLQLWSARARVLGDKGGEYVIVASFLAVKEVASRRLRPLGRPLGRPPPLAIRPAGNPGSRWLSGYPARFPPRGSGFDPRPGHSGLLHAGIVLDDAVDQRVFSGISPFPPYFHSGAAPYPLQSPSSALKTSMLRAVQISSLALSPHMNSDLPLCSWLVHHRSGVREVLGSNAMQGIDVCLR